MALAPYSDAEYTKGALLQVNWAPVWKSGCLLEGLHDELLQKMLQKSPSNQMHSIYINLLMPPSDARSHKKRKLDTRLDAKISSKHEYMPSAHEEDILLGLPVNELASELRMRATTDGLMLAQVDNPVQAPPVSKPKSTSKRMSLPKITFLDASHSTEEEQELERIFRSGDGVKGHSST